VERHHRHCHHHLPETRSFFSHWLVSSSFFFTTHYHPKKAFPTKKREHKTRRVGCQRRFLYPLFVHDFCRIHSFPQIRTPCHSQLSITKHHGIQVFTLPFVFFIETSSYCCCCYSLTANDETSRSSSNGDFGFSIPATKESESLGGNTVLANLLLKSTNCIRCCTFVRNGFLAFFFSKRIRSNDVATRRRSGSPYHESA